MPKSNAFKSCSLFSVFIFLCLNHRSTANDQCLLSLPVKGYAVLRGGGILSHVDIEDSPWLIDDQEYINYVCYQGYRLHGEEEVKCEDGQLTPDVPKCLQIVCNDPPVIENGFYEKDELNKTFNEATFLNPICKEGFRRTFKSKSKIKCIRVLGWKLVWSRPPICEVNPKCEDPGVPTNGSRVGDSIYAGDNVRFSCDHKFKMIGMNEIKCLEDATWSSPAPICEEIPYCGDPGTPVSGFRFGDAFFEGDEVSFACGVEDDELVGFKTIKCGRDGLWNSPRPRCKPPSACPDPPQLDQILYASPNRTRDFYIPGDVVFVSCQSGYALDGDYGRYHCTENTPKEKNPPEYNYVGFDDELYDYVEEPQKEGPFWKEEFLHCKEITCQSPKTPRKGFIHEFLNKNQTIERTFPYDYTLNYGCLEGYQIVGSHFSTCLETGWTPSNSEVRCKKIMCPVVNNIENGYYEYMSPSQRYIGNIVEFGCLNGFNLSGSKSRECLENGQWSGDLPKCVGNTFCPDPGTPLRGFKFGNNYSEGGVIEFACDSESTLIGSKTRLCLENGTWSGTEVLCKKYTDFDRPLEMQFRLLTHLDSTVLLTDSMTADKYDTTPTNLRELPPVKKLQKFGRILDTSYSQGNLVLYFIFDSSTSVGPKSFNLSVDFVKALVKRIKVSSDGVRVGGAAFSKEIHGDQGFVPLDYTTTPDVVDALDRLKSNRFKGGGTNIQGALSYFETAIYPSLVQKLTKPKTHIFLLTDGNYNTGGDPRALAKTMKKRGVEFSCVGVSGNKETNMKLINEIASKSTNVYNLKDYDHMKWLVDQVLTDKVDYSRCGLTVKSEVEPNAAKDLGRIYGGKVTKTYWPWMAMLSGPSVKSPLIKGFCGGSLIDRKWILTAAHCMYYKNSTRRGDKDIEVRLGYTKADNHNHSETISSRNIFIHESFTFNSFDTDVALIKLERPANYERRIRPVCLSPADKDIPKDSALYADNSAGWAIGYGKFQDEAVDVRETFRDLREVALDIGPKNKCANGLKGSFFKYTANMFCAGGTKGVDTCEGDSGGPFMKRQYHTDGDGYWVQTGIVSFSPRKQCGLGGVYGYYTKLSAVREWIEAIIRNN